jgi:membrane-associated phospholipid phosphatase
MSALWRRAQFADRLYGGWLTAAAGIVIWQRDRVDAWPALLVLHVAALLLVATLVARSDRQPAIHAWYPLLMPLATFPAVARLNLAFVPAWQDGALLAFEGWLFAEPPTVWLPRVTPPLLAELFRAGYLSYFLLLAAVAGLFWWRRQEAAFRGVMAASVLAYLTSYVIFLAWPMEGPAHTLQQLAIEPLPGGPMRAVVRFVQHAGVHGNAFPSAHVAGAVPPLVYAWIYARRLGAVALVAVLTMGLGAVHDGYHYASDVVAGAVVGAAAAAAVLAAQHAPAWARRLHLPLLAAPRA